jgi:hypothetical protein
MDLAAQQLFNQIWKTGPTRQCSSRPMVVINYWSILFQNSDFGFITKGIGILLIKFNKIISEIILAVHLQAFLFMVAEANYFPTGTP